ncbi:hypothetical protein SAMN05216548_10817 [Faunimonas pinastri]|uniref:Uncharacterized protein n=2 Tax=Faunimonas pinastri TaxID=1855383 RepID=A0A1H9J5T7_9HYPH|nr:hypothetical protein SAMN05216548_10817 [Faunimonas pinastri]
MAADATIAIIAGSGALPPLVAAAAVRSGRAPVVMAIAGEADPLSFAGLPVHIIRWGEIGKLFQTLAGAGCRQAIFIGAIGRRPDYRTIRPDFGAVMLIPRIIRMMRSGDDGMLRGVAQIFAEKGVELVSALDVAPELSLGAGCVTRVEPSPDALEDVRKAADAARAIGGLDIGQAAVAMGGRVVALEGAEGTDGLMARLDDLRKSGRIPSEGGVLVKCVKPRQDPRIDLPTIGPETARRAKRAGLAGVAADAGRTLMAGRTETLAAFEAEGLFLYGLSE